MIEKGMGKNGERNQYSKENRVKEKKRRGKGNRRTRRKIKRRGIWWKMGEKGNPY